jgi:multidrug efflux pump subunit AcrB
MNGSPDTIAGLNHIPVLHKNGATTYLSEVARVRDGFSPQTNIVRQNGERGVLLSVLKNGSSSTLDIVNTLKGLLQRRAQTLPKELTITRCSTSRCSSRPPSVAWCARPSSPPR